MKVHVNFKIVKETVFGKPWLAQVSEKHRDNGNNTGFMTFYCWGQDGFYSARKDSMFLVLSVVEWMRVDVGERAVLETFKVIDPEGKIRILDRYILKKPHEFLVPVKFDPET